MAGTGHKKTPTSQGFGVTAHSPHLAAATAGIGTLPARTSGLPGFIGPFPSTSLDESDLIVILLFVYLHAMPVVFTLLRFLLYARRKAIVNALAIPASSVVDPTLREGSPTRRVECRDQDHTSA